MIDASTAPVGRTVLKQKAYAEYAAGKISLHELRDRVTAIVPPMPPRWYKAVGLVFTILSAFLLPHWGARRD